MGYLRRHAIILTGGILEGLTDIRKAHAKACEIFPWVSPMSDPQVNGEISFFIPPDGSKEGWAESEAGNQRRDDFIAWLQENDRQVDCWVEVVFGDEAGAAYISRES